MTNEEIMNLKAAEVKAKATELQIPGRSKMSTAELRVAIADHYAREQAREYVASVSHLASPMDSNKRQRVYEADRNGGPISPRQRRRMTKKNNRALRPAA